jgi:hypothetical protein
MLREGPTEPMLQRGSIIHQPGAARAARTIQAQVDIQETMLTLADQLLIIFDEIPSAGLIKRQRRAIHQHVQTYFRIADGIWEALATDQLADLIGNSTYTAAADTLEQELVQLHEDCQQAEQNPKARGGWFWQRRARLYSQALLEWKRCIDTGSGGALPDPTACGRVLYRAHGQVGLAGISGFDYMLVRNLPRLGALASLLLAVLFGAIDMLAPNGLAHYLAPAIVAAFITLTLLWFSTTGSSPLPLVVGYALTRRRAIILTRAARASGTTPKIGQGVLRVVLRTLLTTLGTLFLPGFAALLALIVLLAHTVFTELPNGGGQDAGGYMTTTLQSILGQTLPIDGYLLTILLPVFCLVSVAVFFLPCTLSVQARLTKVLLGHPTRSPEARRYPLQPALELLSFHTTMLFYAAILANSVFNLGVDSVLPSGWLPISQRLLVYIAGLALPYVLLIDLPYRLGIARWRGVTLHELTLRRTEVARRLSRTQPQSADPSDLRTMQDYVIWQYYRTQEGEVRGVRLAPLSIGRYLLALLLVILGGVALDWINGLLYSVLQIRV